MVFQMGHAGESLKYRDVRDKVMSIASHRAQMAVPAPMDIGQVGGRPECDLDYWEELEGDAVAKQLLCHRCGGWGHFARDCPTQPEGKGFKGKGKGKNDAHKGWKGGKAASKGTFPGKGEFGPTKGAKGSGKG